MSALGLILAVALGTLAAFTGWGLAAVLAAVIFAVCAERRGWLDGF